MRARFSPHSLDLRSRLPRLTPLEWAELALIALIAIQAARLAWILVTPVGPLGDYRGAAPAALPRTAILGEFDPFFRLAGAGGPAVVTGLNLRLHGVREDRATGRGSAIIALPDGSQRSFAVGEEIVPGVTLAAVGADNVTINRNGAPEQIFLDQSQPAPPSGAPAPGQAPPNAAMTQAQPAAAPPPARAAAPAAAATQGAPRFEPRQSGTRFGGIAVAGDPQALRASGFAPGDLIVAINGQRVTSMDQARLLARQSGGPTTVIINRGGRAVPVRMRLNL